MSMLENGRSMGRQAAIAARTKIPVMKKAFADALELYPTLLGTDLGQALRAYDVERLTCYPDYARFPELRGLLDRYVGERQGFVEASGLAPAMAQTLCAFHYSWFWFLSRRVNAHHLSRYDLMAPRQCTNVFFPHGKDGVTLSDNRDDLCRPNYYEAIPKFHIRRIPDKRTVSPWQGGVSSAVLLDEEPTCCFPCNPHQLMPPECFDDINEMVRFMTRYREFYGPGNQLWCDNHLNTVAVEKSNCRVAFRWPTVNGASCIGACSYLDPDLNAFKKERSRLAMALKGETEATCPDWNFFEGCDAHHRRLIALTNQEARNDGGTLWGALNIVADHAVPYPERICLAGEKLFPDKEPNAMWSLTQYAAVITGPRRRALYRSLQDLRNPKPVYTYTPKLVLGEGVRMQPEWQADIDKGLCELAPDMIEPAPRRRAARRSAR